MWMCVGGTPASFVRAGMLGVPLMVGIIGGVARQFRLLIACTEMPDGEPVTQQRRCRSASTASASSAWWMARPRTTSGAATGT